MKYTCTHTHIYQYMHLCLGGLCFLAAGFLSEWLVSRRSKSALYFGGGCGWFDLICSTEFELHLIRSTWLCPQWSRNRTCRTFEFHLCVRYAARALSKEICAMWPNLGINPPTCFYDKHRWAFDHDVIQFLFCFYGNKQKVFCFLANLFYCELGPLVWNNLLSRYLLKKTRK